MPASSSLRRLLPDAFWTLLNNVLSVLGGLAVVKLVSMLVPASDYGEANLVLGIVSLLTLFLINPMLTAQLRLYFDHARSLAADSYVGAVEPMILRSAGLMAGAYLLIATVYRLGGQGSYLGLALPAILLCLLTPHVNATLNFIEARRQYRSLTLAQTLTRLAPAPFLALLLVTPLPRASAIILAQCLALALVFILYRRSARVAPSPRPDSAPATPASLEAAQTDDAGGGHGPAAPDLSGSATFGWSLYLYNATIWMITTSDRYIIDWFWSPREVGFYAINYGLCAMPYLMLNGWIETFTRSRLYGRAAAGDAAGVRAIMRGRFILAVGGSLIGTAALYVLIEPVGLLLLGPQYWRGRGLAMTLCAAYAFYAMGNVYHSLFIAVKRVRVLAWTAFLAAGTNIAMNLVLVPRLGIRGAAFSTLAAFVIWFVALTVSARALLSRGAWPWGEAHGAAPPGKDRED